MQFLFPQFLWALLALAIPIIIHLFYFRRFKKVYFTNVHLLKELKQETSNRNRLKSLLILIARCLALAALVFAFAQPILHKQNAGAGDAQKLIFVFIDNSFSMNAAKDDVPLFTIAKDKARDIVSAYNDYDKFVLITHDLSPKHLRLLDQKTVLGFIDELALTPKVVALEQVSTIVQRISYTYSEWDKQYYVVSDFQENIALFETTLDSSYRVSLVPIRSVQENNIAILSARFEAPVPVLGQNNNLIVEFANNGANAEDVEFRMIYGGQERPMGIVHLEAGTKRFDTLAIKIANPGWHDIELIIDDFPIVFDDHLFLTFHVKESLSVLTINEGTNNSYIDYGVKSLPAFDLNQLSKNAIKYDQLGRFQLIILDELKDFSSGLIVELVKYVQSGGNLLFFPAKDHRPGAYNELLEALHADGLGGRVDQERQVQRLNEDDFVFNEVFETVSRNIRMPTAQHTFALIEKPSISRINLMTYRDGGAYLTKYPRGKGIFYLSTAPLNKESNGLVLNAEIFVPMLYKMALARGTAAPLAYTIGEDQLIGMPEINSTDGGQYRVSDENSEFIPSIVVTAQGGFIDVRDQITTAGIKQLAKNENRVSNIAFNYDRMESNVLYGDLKSISTTIGQNVMTIEESDMKNINSFITQQVQGRRLWRVFLIIALLFLLAETLLIRFWK